MVKNAKNITSKPATQTKVNRNVKKNVRNSKRIKRNKIDVKKNGLVYLGHVPHGFYEPEMREFFSQFGRVTSTKVCRSGRTGNSKGYGFVEFAQPEVAKIAAETMDNYLMFKKRLEAKFVSPEKRPKYLFERKRNETLAQTPASKRRQRRQYESKNSKETNVNEEVVLKKMSKKAEILKKRNVEIPIETVLVRRSCRNKQIDSA